MTRSGLAVWSTPQWREQSTAWADDALAAHGIRRTGETQQPHLRPWSTVLRLPTTAGSVWLKAPGPATVAEVSLVPVLSRRAGDRVLIPYAVDVPRGWLLLPDGGAVLATNTPEALEVWNHALRGYAELQLQVVPHVDELLAAGAPDHRPARLPQLLDEVVAEARPHARTEQERAVVEAAAGRRGLVEDLAGLLEREPHHSSVQHDDLHRDNVFRSGARVFDWGDAVVGHPFSSLLVALRDTAEPLGVGLEDPRVVAARDAYLEAYGGPTAANLTALSAARTLGVLSRAASWLRVLGSVSTQEAREVREAPIRWLGMLGPDEPF
ncbi:phosphotransferase [Dermatophilaceae bacterium Soc4.6]